jgi:hypothetical protein
MAIIQGAKSLTGPAAVLVNGTLERAKTLGKGVADSLEYLAEAEASFMDKALTMYWPDWVDNPLACQAVCAYSVTLANLRCSWATYLSNAPTALSQEDLYEGFKTSFQDGASKHGEDMLDALGEVLLTLIAAYAPAALDTGLLPGDLMMALNKLAGQAATMDFIYTTFLAQQLPFDFNNLMFPEFLQTVKLA